MICPRCNGEGYPVVVGRPRPDVACGECKGEGAVNRLYYRDYLIEYDPPPIPLRSHDYSFAHVDFDGGPWEVDGPPMDQRHGTAGSLAEAKAAIDELIEEM